MNKLKKIKELENSGNRFCKDCLLQVANIYEKCPYCNSSNLGNINITCFKKKPCKCNKITCDECFNRFIQSQIDLRKDLMELKKIIKIVKE